MKARLRPRETAIEFVRLGPEELAQARGAIVEVHHAAFAGPPYNEGEIETERTVDRLISDARRDGYRCYVARDESAQIVGLSYGLRGQAGQWWYDRVSERITPAAAEEWLRDCFQFDELAVIPGMQGRGIGGRLHDLLLTGLGARTAVLSTYCGETSARRLYQKRGWKTLLSRFTFPGYDVPMMILGLVLTTFQEEMRA